MNYCKYGCGQEGNFKLKNGKWCCSEKWQSCPENRNKNSIRVKEGRRLEKEKGIKRKSALNTIKITCQYCSKIISVQNFKRHEFSCYLNPENIRLCPICETHIKDKEASTCSQKCAQVYFRDMFNEVRKTRDMSWSNGHLYRFICFKYHEKKCIICDEDVIVAVHHYDQNKKNNDPRNLVPLCPTHHMYMHSYHIYLIKECVDEYVEKFKQLFQGGSIGEAAGR